MSKSVAALSAICGILSKLKAVCLHSCQAFLVCGLRHSCPMANHKMELRAIETQTIRNFKDILSLLNILAFIGMSRTIRDSDNAGNCTCTGIVGHSDTNDEIML